MLNAFIIEGHFDERHKATAWSNRDYQKFRIEHGTQLIGGYTRRVMWPSKDLSVNRLNPT